MSTVRVSAVLERHTKLELVSAIQSRTMSEGGAKLATIVLGGCLVCKTTQWLDCHDALMRSDGDDLIVDDCQFTVTVGEIKREECLSLLAGPVRDALNDPRNGSWDDDGTEVTVVGNQLAFKFPEGEPLPPEAIDDMTDALYLQTLRDFGSGLAFLADEYRQSGALGTGSDSAVTARLAAWHKLRGSMGMMVAMHRSGVIALAELDDDDLVKQISYYVGAVTWVCADWQKLPRAEVRQLLSDAQELRPDLDMSDILETVETWPY